MVHNHTPEAQHQYFPIDRPHLLKTRPNNPKQSKIFHNQPKKVLKGEKLTLGDLDLNVVDSTEIFMNKVTNEQQLYQRELVGNGFGLCQKPLGLDSPEDHESQWYSDIRLSEYPPVAADLG